jgi:hypothetical protein
LFFEGNLVGVFDEPSGKLSFPGKHVRLGYCSDSNSGEAPSWVTASDQSNAGDMASTITGPKGLSLSCGNGELPFVLDGSVEGTLNTGKGIVSLHGDHNNIAVCLTLAKSN